MGEMDSSVGVRKKRTFSTTHWSLVTSAAEGDTPQSKAALEELCERYWYPLYVFVRQKGYERDDARDLVQGFFTRLIEQRRLAIASPLKGRFRTYLLVALDAYINSWWRYERAQKHYPKQIVSWDLESAERRYWLEPVEKHTPEKIFERRWASLIVSRAREGLEEHYRSSGREEVYRRLIPFLEQVTEAGRYKYLAEEWKVSPERIAALVYHMRQRYGELVRREVAQTLENQDDLEDEMAYLMGLLREG